MTLIEEKVAAFKNSSISFLLRTPTPVTQKYYDRLSSRLLKRINEFYMKTNNCPQKIWIEKFEFQREDEFYIEFFVAGQNLSRDHIRRIKGTCILTGLKKDHVEFEKDILFNKQYPLPLPY